VLELLQTFQPTPPSSIIDQTSAGIWFAKRFCLLLAWTLIFTTLEVGANGYAQQPRTPERQTDSPTSAWTCAASEQAEVRPIWQGEHGWLFSRPDLITELALPDTATFYLKRLASALGARGITPVALVVPTRGSVAADRRGTNPALASYNPEAAARGYRAFLARLRRAGFIAPDLLTVARAEGDAFFFKRDHHWTPAAAQAVARSVAARLEASLASLPKTAFVSPRAPSKKQLGTLQRRVEARCPGFSLPLESVPQFQTRLRRPEKADGAALFTATAPEVVLVGTSNSHRGEEKPELDFDGFLRQALSLEVLNVAFPGAGVYGSLEAYLRSSEYRKTPPRVLLWETTYMSWHRRGSLGTEQRQVLPSVYGACPRPLATRAHQTLPKGKTVLLGGLKVSRTKLGHGAYLQLVLDDPSLVKFDLELRYRNLTERVALAHTTRVANSGEFFFDLASSAAPLEAVILHSPKAASGGVKLNICPAPLPSAAVNKQ